MKKVKHFLMTLGVALISIFINSINAKAQFAELVDTGTVLNNDIHFSDINGNEFSLHSVLDEGYTVVIELGLTTCSICWTFSQAGVFNNLYEQYGPEGKTMAKKIFPMFIECNPSTTDADLRGTGTNTLGDWVTGHDYPIVDLTSGNARGTLRNFFKSEVLSFTTPSFLIICPDRKVVFTGVGALAGVNEQLVVNYMEGRCATKVGIDDASNSTGVASVRLYPNPVIDLLNIRVEAPAKTSASFSITNLLGEVLYTESARLQAGEQIRSVPTANLSSGLYLFSVTTGHGTVVRQFVKR